MISKRLIPNVTLNDTDKSCCVVIGCSENSTKSSSGRRQKEHDWSETNEYMNNVGMSIVYGAFSQK